MDFKRLSKKLYLTSCDSPARIRVTVFSPKCLKESKDNLFLLKLLTNPSITTLRKPFCTQQLARETSFMFRFRVVMFWIKNGDDFSCFTFYKHDLINDSILNKVLNKKWEKCNIGNTLCNKLNKQMVNFIYRCWRDFPFICECNLCKLLQYINMTSYRRNHTNRFYMTKQYASRYNIWMGCMWIRRVRVRLYVDQLYVNRPKILNTPLNFQLSIFR